MKANVLATGYGQDLLDPPITKTHHAERRDAVELQAGRARRTRRSRSSSHNLKKYAGITGVPDYGVYTGYITCDLAILGLQNAGKNPTRQGFVDGIRNANGGTYDAADLTCTPVDISLDALREDQQHDGLHLLRAR